MNNGADMCVFCTARALRAEAAEAALREIEAALRSLIDFAMTHLPNDAWKIIEPKVWGVRSLANPRAEAAEHRIRELEGDLASMLAALVKAEHRIRELDIELAAHLAEQGLHP